MENLKKASKGQIGRIVAMLTSGQIPFLEAQMLIERHAKKRSEPPKAANTLVDTGLSVAEIVSQAVEARKICVEDNEAWSLLMALKEPSANRGKRYEVKTWTPKQERLTVNQVRAYFARDGYYGDPALFAMWIAAKLPEGDYSSFAQEDARLWSDPLRETAEGPTFSIGRDYYAVPFYSRFGQRDASFAVMDIESCLDSCPCYVGFREIINIT